MTAGDFFWPILSTSMLVLGFVAGTWALSKRQARKRNDFTRHMNEVARRSYAMIDAALELAEREADVGEMFTPRMPEKVVTALAQSVGVAQALQQYARAEIQRRGLIPGATVAFEPAEAEPTEERPSGAIPLVSAVRPGPPIVWRDGVPVPARRLEAVPKGRPS